MSALQSPAQVLLARTPATPSTATASTSGAPSRPRSAAATTQAHAVAQSQELLPLAVHVCFSPLAANAGTVKISVEDSTFYCHRDVLIFSSPFFEALLCGDWQETSSDAGTSLVGPSRPSPGAHQRAWNSSSNRPVSTTTDIDDVEQLDEEAHAEEAAARPLESDRATVATSFIEDMREMGVQYTKVDPTQDEAELVGDSLPIRGTCKRVEARITLHEEQAAAFQDLLFHVYPHLECVIHWNNVADLITMSHKFDMPPLRKQCIAFLMASAAGKPVLALQLAETHALPDLYRESSRYVLDNWSVWEPSDLDDLSHGTLLRLEKRRNWFLERLLKLGLINAQRDYVCCGSCPDPQHCARLLEEKWRSAWQSAFRYGSPAPSNIYRNLRMLEPSLASPALNLTHTNCQNHARAYVADLFDRMFSLGIPAQRPYGLSNAASRAPLEQSLNKKYFLYIDLKTESLAER